MRGVTLFLNLKNIMQMLVTKRIILILFLVFLSNTVYSQNRTVFKLVNCKTGESIENAVITFRSGTQSIEAKSDKRGFVNVSLPFPNGTKLNISIKANGYHTLVFSNVMPDALFQRVFCLQKNE